MRDTIHISGLQLPVRLGVPDEERERWQTVEVDVSLVTTGGFGELEDDLERTVDYEGLSLDLRDLAAARPRKLLETLADELATLALEHELVEEVTLTLRKFVLPGTKCVAVSVKRSA